MTKRAAVLLPSQLRHLLRVTEATSRHPERDAVILWLGFSCGLRVTETARLTVADVLLPSGRVKSEISLRAEITKGCRKRLAYLTHPKLIAALERYIEWRKAKERLHLQRQAVSRAEPGHPADSHVEGRTL